MPKGYNFGVNFRCRADFISVGGRFYDDFLAAEFLYRRGIILEYILYRRTDFTGRRIFVRNGYNFGIYFRCRTNFDSREDFCAEGLQFWSKISAPDWFC